VVLLLAEPTGAVLTCSADVIAVLSVAERQRAGRFRRPTDRDDFVAAHVAVRLCVAALTGGPAQGIGIGQRCEQCDYGQLSGLARHQINTDLIATDWDELLRVAGSLATGTVRASENTPVTPSAPTADARLARIHRRS